MSTLTEPHVPRSPTGATDLFGQVSRLSRNDKEHLLVLLQEDLDGGPFVGDLPEKPADDAGNVKRAWQETIARRIDEMRTGKIERIDAQGSAERLLLRMLRKFAP